jgi:hypothetical protein
MLIFRWMPEIASAEANLGTALHSAVAEISLPDATAPNFLPSTTRDNRQFLDSESGADSGLGYFYLVFYRYESRPTRVG